MSHESPRPVQRTDGSGENPSSASPAASPPMPEPLAPGLSRALFDALPDAIVMVGDDGVIAEANAAACAIVGLSRDAVVGAAIANFLQPGVDYDSAHAALLRDGRARGKGAVLRGARPVPVEFSLSRFGDPGRVLLTLHEIEEGRPENPDDGADVRFRRAFESSPSPALVCDRNSLRIIAVNDAAIEEYGYSRDEFAGMTLADLRPADRQPDGTGRQPQFADGRTERRAPQPAAKEHEQGGLWRHRCKDGSTIEVEITSRLLSSDDDRTELLLVHDPHVKQMAAHHFSLSAELFEASNQAIAVTDAECHVVAVNPAFTRITGYGRDEVIGKNPRLLSSGRHDRAFYEAMWGGIRNQGHWQGEIWNRRKNGEVYPEWLTVSAVKNSRGEIVQYVGMFSDISERKAAEARIEYLAHYDPLTGLPNRTLLQDRFTLAIAQAKRSHRRVGVLFLDLDRFKKVNDTLGHSAGDSVLQQTAHRLRGCLRQADFVARQGGDEFIAIISDLDMIHDAAHVAQKIIKAMGRAMEVHGHEIHMSPSIGISIYPDDGNNIEALLKNADIAMYQAKNAGRNNYQFFAQEMNESAFEHLAFETSLRRALDNQEFVLHYQPQIDIASGRITGAEALIRWRHPDLGMVSPAQFIPVAEESGLIVPISTWVLQQACAQAATWRKVLSAPLRVGINVSALQFRHRDFVELVTDTIDQSGIEASALELELTESVVMHDADSVIAKLLALQEVGVGLAIDDFGTGYSSLSYLKRFPIDRLKIDQSFVSDIGRNSDSEAIIQAIISMAHSLRLQTLAEGVETVEQFNFLRDHGGEEVQGYLFSRPIPSDDLHDLIRSGKQFAL